VQGLGFASALGIEQAWSWTLLSSLAVFNVGIEFVQLAIIVAVFPVLALLRRRAPLAGLSTTGLIAAAVCAAGKVWFVERSLQL
jgi:HupE / UreJ protein